MSAGLMGEIFIGMGGLLRYLSRLERAFARVSAMTAQTEFHEDRPFPLARLFLRRILPGFVLFVAALLGLVIFAVRHTTESIYLEQAQRRAEGIVQAVSTAVPQIWEGFLAGRALPPGEMDALREAFAHEAVEFSLIKLNVFDLSGIKQFASDGRGVGRVDTAEGLQRALNKREPSIVRAEGPGHETAYEIYIPFFDADKTLRAVIEMYEPVDYVDDVMLRAIAAPVAVPGALLALLAAVLWRLVARAQADIDARTEAVVSLRRKLETFVSAGAVAAARAAGGAGEIPSRRVRCTLLFSDVRSFTAFSESNPPETVVDFLNRLMALQVRIVRARGGDVDKLIGDALLARFDGAGATARALAAAREVLAEVRAAGLSPGVGIGVFTGEAIMGAVGPAERRDFTVIGDAVNVAARLCSAAAEGELVADSASAAEADAAFAPEETIRVKGREAALAVRRLRA
ncbi:MAG: adenylate/guanylate cyclase domain-containing protein [Rhodospirillales bacterium]|nr:adenylate/guanylate cyclase domain-containing protein [Rhodospirillales bacterium]